MEMKNVKADISVGRYTLDAKSLMGILTMDLNRPMVLNLYEDDYKNNEILGLFEAFLVS